MIQLTAARIEAFAGMYLSPLYDEAAPTPDFHRECWDLYCGPAPAVAIAAPRGHAKSTALTHVYGLANVLFRVEPHVLLLSATEELAMGHLTDIAAELRENDDIRSDFGVRNFETDSKGEIIVKCDDGYLFRILARGSGQKLRGLKWRGRRPGLIIGDDLEEDEQVESADRREKFRRWVMRAVIPLLRRGGKMRWHGTILHEAAMLSNLMKDPAWTTRLYKAHAGFDDFTDILWPEQFDEARLREIRQRYIGQNDAPGYSQEYLNDPLDNSDAYLRRDDFLPMKPEDHEVDKKISAAWDFAVSQAARADNTSCTVGGKDIRNLLHIVDQRKGKWDALQIIDEMFMVQIAWDPETHWVEDGVIWKSLAPMVHKEMQERDIWMNIVPLPSVKDKATRGRIFQRRHRGHGMRFDKDASWYPDYEFELLRFTENAKALRDDQFDSTSLLCRGFETKADLEEDDFWGEEEEEFDRESRRYAKKADGRSSVTGY